MTNPFVSIGVICFNEEINIGTCLDSLFKQDYPKNNFEIIVVDSGSTDATISLVQHMQKDHENLRLYVSNKKSISVNRNYVLREAKADLAAYLDADCSAPSDWLTILVEGYTTHKKKDSLIAAVGGSNIPPQDTVRFHRVLSIFMKSYYGTHGSIQGAHYCTDRLVRHIPTLNVLYEKQKLIDIGGFDIDMHNMIEDEDMSVRLRHKGFKLMYIHRSFVWHKLHDNYTDFFRSMFFYGKGRAWYFKKHFMDSPKILLLPAILVTGFFGIAFGWYCSCFFLPLVYLPLIFLVSVHECVKTHSLPLIFNLFFLYAGTHISYGCGELCGFFKKRKAPPGISE